MPRISKEYIESGDNIYICQHCSAHLANKSDLISRSFHGRSGKAYLFNTVINTYDGPSERRMLLTGIHVVADLFCLVCSSYVGWRYLQAYDESQKYKEGKFILERQNLVKHDW